MISLFYIILKLISTVNFLCCFLASKNLSTSSMFKDTIIWSLVNIFLLVLILILFRLSIKWFKSVSLFRWSNNSAISSTWFLSLLDLLLFDCFISSDSFFTLIIFFLNTLSLDLFLYSSTSLCCSSDKFEKFLLIFSKEIKKWLTKWKSFYFFWY